MARNTGKKVRRRGRRRKRGFATWSIGKKIGAVLGGTLLGVVVIGSVILASKMNKLSSVKLDTDKLNISDEVKHEKGREDNSHYPDNSVYGKSLEAISNKTE